MNCRRCDSHLPVGARFCENCGEIGPTPAEWRSYVVRTLLALLKKRPWLTITVVGVLILAIGFGFFIKTSRTIDITDYVLTQTSGFNETGNIVVSMDYEALCEKLFGGIPSPDSKKDYEKYVSFTSQIQELKNDVIVYADRNNNLKNGDFYLVTVKILDSDIFTNHGFELDETEYHKTLQIGKDCPEFEPLLEIDLFEYIESTIVGENGSGSLQISSRKKDEALVFPSGKQIKLSIVYERTWDEHYLVIYQDEPYISTTVNLHISEQSNLSNGDMVEVKIDGEDARNLAKYGIQVKTHSLVYQVSGLTN